MYTICRYTNSVHYCTLHYTLHSVSILLDSTYLHIAPRIKVIRGLISQETTIFLFFANLSL